jgi:hypothetical protein
MEVTVIDDSDFTGFAASASRENEIYMKDVESMVNHVLAHIRPYSRTCSPGQKTFVPMSRLNILDHGNANSLQIGSDRISVTSLPKFRAKLGQLKGKFTDNGFVHLQHCEIGQNRVLLIELAKVFGVSVYAGTGGHNPVYRFNFGKYVRAAPDGSFATGVGRP